MNRLEIRLLFFTGLSILGTGFADFGWAGEATFQEKIESAGPAKIESLVDRSLGNHSKAGDAFYEILWLREHPDSAAVDALAEIARKRMPSRTFHFAAMQALFAEGSTTALAAVEEISKLPGFNARLSILYSDKFEMAAPARGRFVHSVHFNENPNGLALRVSCKRHAAVRPSYGITIELQNVSDTAFCIPEPTSSASLLIARQDNPDRSVVYTLAEQTVACDQLVTQWLTLQPKEKKKFQFDLVQSVDGKSLESPRMRFPFPNLETVRLIGMIELSPGDAEHSQHRQASESELRIKGWHGRAFSDPVQAVSSAAQNIRSRSTDRPDS